MEYARRSSINVHQTGRTKWEYHLYSLSPLTSLSVNTPGPLKEDENENCFIIVVVDNFSKLIGLYPAKKTPLRTILERLYNGGRFLGYLRRSEATVDHSSHQI